MSVFSGGRIVLRRISTVTIALASSPASRCAHPHVHDLGAATDDFVADAGPAGLLFLEDADLLLRPIGGNRGIAGDSLAGPARRSDNHARPPTRHLRLSRLHSVRFGCAFLELGSKRSGQPKPEQPRLQEKTAIRIVIPREQSQNASVQIYCQCLGRQSRQLTQRKDSGLTDVDLGDVVAELARTSAGCCILINRSRRPRHVGITCQSPADPRNDERFSARLRDRGRRRTRSVDRPGRPIALGRAVGREDSAPTCGRRPCCSTPWPRWDCWRNATAATACRRSCAAGWPRTAPRRSCRCCGTR